MNFEFLRTTCRMTSVLLAKKIFLNEKITAGSLRELAAAQRKALGVTCTVADENGRQFYANNGPFIFVLLNQTSLVEFVLSPEALPMECFIFGNVRFLLFPFVGWLAAATAAVPVIPGWRWQTKYAVKEACTRLSGNPQSAMYMSIEGRRTPDGYLSTYRLGCARIAIATGATVVPVIIQGARECLAYGQFRVKPGHCTFRLLPAIPVKGGDAVSLTNVLRNIAERELPAAVPPTQVAS